MKTPDPPPILMQKSRLQYAIITNPASGRLDRDGKHRVLSPAADVLGAEIHGLDTTSPEELGQCSRDLADPGRVLVVAGGDGTFSDVINNIDPARIPVAFLPLGTGNALSRALGYSGGVVAAAHRIRAGEIREYDLISCDGKRRGFMASVGFEGTVTRIREQLARQGIGGLPGYCLAVLRAYLKHRERTAATLVLDRRSVQVNRLLSLMVVKQPYYGFGLEVVPGARFDDRRLHVLSITSGALGCVVGLATALTVGNRIGRCRTGGRLSASLEKPRELQIDGSPAWTASRFTFTILPKKLRIKC